jgi:hypothetical protein
LARLFHAGEIQARFEPHNDDPKPGGAAYQIPSG